MTHAPNQGPEHRRALTIAGDMIAFFCLGASAAFIVYCIAGNLPKDASVVLLVMLGSTALAVIAAVAICALALRQSSRVEIARIEMLETLIGKTLESGVVKWPTGVEISMEEAKVTIAPKQ